MKLSTDLVIIGAVVIGGYFLYKKTAAVLPTALNITNPRNVANTLTTNIYQGITGSNQGPSQDFADYVYKDADSNSVSILANFFVSKGINADTQAQAANMGWSQTDITKAVAIATPELDATKYIYELPPIL